MNDLKHIKLLILDCDGVLSDGKIIYTEEGWESKSFSVADGLGLSLLSFTEIKCAVITGRRSLALERRCRDLKIDYLFQGVRNKRAVIEDILQELSLAWENAAYMGDDWNDFPALTKAGLPAAPQQAAAEIKEKAEFVSRFRGGEGAVREFIEYILRKQGIFEEVIEKFIIRLSEDEEDH
jgi:3-deoxy-D-manno-octulosonate 8-phosphate phosphatase (KDO 8-P phosphatase)